MKGWNHQDIKIDTILTITITVISRILTITITVISRISVGWLIGTVIITIANQIIDLSVIMVMITRRTYWGTAQRRRPDSFQQQQVILITIKIITIIFKIIVVIVANKAIAVDYIHNQCQQLYHQITGVRGLILQIIIATENKEISNKSSTGWVYNLKDNNNILASRRWTGWTS